MPPINPHLLNTSPVPSSPKYRTHLPYCLLDPGVDHLGDVSNPICLKPDPHLVLISYPEAILVTRDTFHWVVRLQISTVGPAYWAWLCWSHSQKISACRLCLEPPCCPVQITMPTTLLPELNLLSFMAPSAPALWFMYFLYPSVSSSRPQAPWRQRPLLISGS